MTSSATAPRPATLTPRTPAPSTPVPALPAPRGPLSATVLNMLQGLGTLRGLGTLPELDMLRDTPGTPFAVKAGSAAIEHLDPYGEDLQLALYCCYELHYRGFAGVAEDLEWDPGLLRLRRDLERYFLTALRADVPGGCDVAAEVDALLVEPVDAESVSHHLRRVGQLWQLREYVAHRSLYHLKEADPQAWVIPRLTGAAKAALVTIEYDEYGAGHPERMHSRLFAEMMAELGLCTHYGAYLDAAPAATLAEVNLMSLCGLHRRLRGALVGQFAAVELTSSPGSDRLVRAMRRLHCGPAAIEFYAEHVEADAVHEQLVRRGVIAPLLAAEPELAADVVFGIQASTLLADRFSAQLLEKWIQNQPTLRHPLPDAPQ
ncbi:MAG: iron-containing redox enzyme family protein [Pseudonocardiaceae bacterium]